MRDASIQKTYLQIFDDSLYISLYLAISSLPQL